MFILASCHKGLKESRLVFFFTFGQLFWLLEIGRVGGGGPKQEGKDGSEKNINHLFQRAKKNMEVKVKRNFFREGEEKIIFKPIQFSANSIRDF